MNALDELIENAKTAHEALEPHYSIKNSGTGINYAYNLLPLFKTEEAATELAALRQERDELKQAAVLAMCAVEEVAFETLKPSMQKLDSYLANGLSNKLWDEINAAALARVDGEK